MFTFKPKKDEENCCSTTASSCSSTPQSNSHDCCTPQPKGKIPCPSCGERAKGVLAKTLAHLLTDAAKSKLECFDGFYYCKTPSCKTVYFKDDTILTQEDVSVVVGLKEGASPATVCYCFGWTKEKIRVQIEENGKTEALEDIKAKMEDPGCSCEILNPSGGCCLGEVGKAIREIEAEYS